MKFEIKTEPVCAVLIAVPALRGHRRRRYRNGGSSPGRVVSTSSRRRRIGHRDELHLS